MDSNAPLESRPFHLRPRRPFELRGVRVWDGHAERTTEAGQVLRIDHEGRIASLADRRGEDGQHDLVFEGAVALPGLIDAHVHLELDPDLATPGQQLAVDRQRRELGVIARGRRMLAMGITTARDLGGGLYMEHAYRDAVAAGRLPGPRLLCAGQPVTTPGGHCHFWGGEAADIDAACAVIDRQVAHGSDWIKLMATGGVFTPGSRSRDAQWSERAIAEMVARAAHHGLPVAAHCHGTEGIANALGGGVQTIEHCSFAGAEGFGSAFDADLVAALGRSSTWISPTVNGGWERRMRNEGKPSKFFERMSGVFRALVDAGARFVASTDAGIPGVHHDALPLGLAAFARYSGLAPVEVLKTATSASARALGVLHTCGALRPGLSADVVVYPEDPLEDLDVLTRPLCVIAGGRVMSAEGEA